MEEIWKDVIGLEGLYQINNFGVLRSLNRTIINSAGHPFTVKGRVIKLNTDKNGYKCYGYRRNGVYISLKPHRLVAKMFVPNPDNKSQVNHINGIKDDNRPENLEWCTCQENITHSVINGLKGIAPGSKNGMSKLTEEQVLEIRSSVGISQGELGKIYGIHPNSIGKIINRKRWAHI